MIITHFGCNERNPFAFLLCAATACECRWCWRQPNEILLIDPFLRLLRLINACNPFLLTHTYPSSGKHTIHLRILHEQNTFREYCTALMVRRLGEEKQKCFLLQGLKPKPKLKLNARSSEFPSSPFFFFFFFSLCEHECGRVRLNAYICSECNVCLMQTNIFFSLRASARDS